MSGHALAGAPQSPRPGESTASAVSVRAAPDRGEWSVIAAYSYPERAALVTIASIESLPSLHTECMCRSPRMCGHDTRPGSSPPGRHGHFLLAVPNFGGDEGQLERGIDLVFGGGFASAPSGVRRPSGVRLPSAFRGARLQRAEVRRRSGQPQQDRASASHIGKTDADLRAIHQQIHPARALCSSRSTYGAWAMAAMTPPDRRRPRRSRCRRPYPRRVAATRPCPPSARRVTPGPVRGSDRRWRSHVPAEYGDRSAQIRQRRLDGPLHGLVEPGNRPHGMRLHRIDQVDERRDAELFVQERELFERDRARFVQPPQIRRQIGDG